MGQVTKWLASLWLPFHWLDLSHMTIPNHKGGWEIQSNYKTVMVTGTYARQNKERKTEFRKDQEGKENILPK